MGTCSPGSSATTTVAIYHFSEYSQNGSSFTRKLMFPNPTGVNHRYWENYNAGNGLEDALVDSTQFDETPFNIFAAWQVSFHPEFFGEVKYVESDMPGTQSNPTPFTNMMAQDYGDNYDFLPNTSPSYFFYRNDSSRWNTEGVNSPGHAYIWTN